MEEAEARAALEALIIRERADYAGLSRLLGRNPAYVQQYVKRGTPRRLAERDRRLLAEFFGVPEEALGGPPRGGNGDAGLVAVPRFAVAASAGAGAFADDAPRRADLLFPAALLRELGVGPSARLELIAVRGDSMLPTLAKGDDILIDRSDGAERLRDGIYVLRGDDDALLVKRLAPRPGGRVQVVSDNRHYPSVFADRAELAILGRVLWAGRKLA